jgi:hypothetical protein
MNSVGQAYAILKGRRHGDQDEAKGFLDSMSNAERGERNRQESRARGSARPKKPYRLGERVRVQRG